ncbi:MAG: DUF1819 family protein [Bacteroidales bacterium]|nr:DUF1819 family protein [Bacteroidales bacterium]
MKINSDINVLGSLPDWNLINVFLTENMYSIRSNGGIQSYTTIKTDKSVKRFEKAIKETFLKFKSNNTELIFKSIISNNGISSESLLFLFWNASQNNELLHYLNDKVFFPAFYSGRVSIKIEEVIACILELRQSEDDIKKWSELTINTTASKYLTLLKKFGLMEGSLNKTLLHPYITDEMFIIFTYWLTDINDWPNLLKGAWLQYGFSELQPFLDRLMQKKFSKYFNVVYTGDKLSIETLISYDLIYDDINKS